MAEAIGWGALAASSLLVGALIGLARPWPRQAVGLVLGIGLASGEGVSVGLLAAISAMSVA